MSIKSDIEIFPELIKQEPIFDDEESDYEDIDITETQLKEESGDTDLDSEAYDEIPEKLSKYDHFIGRDKITQWKRQCLNSIGKLENTLKDVYAPGVGNCAKTARSVLETWQLFFPDEMLDIIVENTNKFIREVSQNYAREGDARPTDVIEIKALLGLLYLGGCFNTQNMEELWAQDGFGVERFYLTMTKNRFFFLLKCLHFDDCSTREERKHTDKLTEVRQVLDIFVRKCQSMYELSNIVAVGEMLLAFRGRCPFKQYVSWDPSRYGIRILLMVDPKLYYTKNLEVYVGPQSDGPHKLQSTQNVVEKLISPISGTFRNVTCSSFSLTSFGLISSLLLNHNLTFVGAVHKNSKELPREFVNTKDRSVFSSIFGYSNDTTIVSYVPKKGKNVIIASSLHHDDHIDPESREKLIPHAVSFFNLTQEAVAKVSQQYSKYDVARNTRRWSVLIFYSLLNIGALNSQFIYLLNNSKDNKMYRREYLRQLSVALTQQQLERRAKWKNIPVELRKRIEEITGVSSSHPKGDPNNPEVRRRCSYCKNKNKTRFFCATCKKFICLKHCYFKCADCI